MSSEPSSSSTNTQSQLNSASSHQNFSVQSLLNRKRKLLKKATSETPNEKKIDGPQKSSNITAGNKDDNIIVIEIDEEIEEVKSEFTDEEKREELRRKAAEALVVEAQRSAKRAEVAGPQGWLKPKSLFTNKRFIANTLISVELSNRDQSENREKMKKRKK